MTQKGFSVILDAMKKVQANNPEIFKPVASFFSVDIQERFNNPEFHKDLYYDEY